MQRAGLLTLAVAALASCKNDKLTVTGNLTNTGDTLLVFKADEAPDTITVKEVKLAEQGYDLNHNKLIDIWHATLVNAENVKTIKFMFDGSRKNDWGLTTPAYMCVDDIIVEHYTE